MKEQQEGLVFLSFLMGSSFAAIGAVNLFVFKAGYYQEMLSAYPIPVALIMFLSVAVFGLGLYLMFAPLSRLEQDRDFVHKAQNLMKMLLVFIGIVLILIGILGSFILYFIDQSSLVQYLVPKFFVFVFVVVGLLIIRFSRRIASWLQGLFLKRSSQ